MRGNQTITLLGAGLLMLASTSVLASIDTRELERLNNQYQRSKNGDTVTASVLDKQHAELTSELSTITAQQGELSPDNRAAIGCANYLLDNQQEGEQQLRQSANNGSGYGAYCLSMVELAQFNAKAGAKWLLSAIERGYPLAPAALAEQYAEEGKTDEAITWYQRAYNQKDERAALNRGMAAANACLLYDQQQKYPQAIEWCKKGAEAGASSAAFNLGNIYDESLNDLNNAAIWFDKAHQMGNENAAYNLGLLYDDAKQYDKAAIWYEKAAEIDHPYAAYNLGYMYVYGVKDYDKAAEWYQKADAIGHPNAAFNLGYMYHRIVKDYAKAERWYQKAIAVGHPKAAYNLAYMYEDLKQYDKAVKWYQEAINVGHPKALFNLAYMYEISVKDYPKAKLWYQKVADSGDKRGYWGIANVLVKQGKRTEGAGYYYYAVKQGNELTAVMDYIDQHSHLTDAELKAGYQWQKTHLDNPYTGEMGL